MFEDITPGRDRADRLIYRFERQASFAAGYSPLYAHLFQACAGWMAAPGRDTDPLASWLLSAAGERSSFDVPILLLAGLHRLVLAGSPGTAALAAYYPTVGGLRPPAGDGLDRALRQAILTNQEALAAFIQTANVQTNETGRGLAWLLPLTYLPWDEVCLVDLGASAGLNLVAEQRAFRLVDEQGTVLRDLGLARPGSQFTTTCTGELAALAAYRPLPRIAGRIGGDILPFSLATPADERTLMAYVWADQPLRLARLREGIDAWRQVQRRDVPVQLRPLNLPDELPAFLAQLPPAGPLLLYNTYMTTYLPDRGAALGEIIHAWAQTQSRPVLWLQWEPPHGYGQVPPHFGWCAWLADYWLPAGAGRQHWLLGWVHPHGGTAQFAAGLADWAAYWAGPSAGRSG